MRVENLLVVSCPDGKVRGPLLNSLSEAKIAVAAALERPHGRCLGFGCPGNDKHKIEAASGYVKSVDLDGSMLPF